MPQVTTQSTYDDNSGVIQKRVITDYITLIDPADAPFVEAMGGLDGGAKKFRFVNFPHTKVEWIEDTREPLAVGLNTAMNNSVTTAVLLAASANMVQVGQILLFADGSEQMWVSAVASDGVTLTVSRGYGGTTATAQVVNNNTAIEILGVARLEGAESTGLGYTVRTTNYNHTQIMQREVKVSRSQNQISQYGIREEFDYQSNKAIPHLMRLIEKAVYKGTRSAGSSAAPRSFGGLGTFVTNNAINSGSAAVTQAKFENALKAAYLDGGKPSKAFVSPTNMQVIKNFYDSANFLRVEITIHLNLREFHATLTICGCITTDASNKQFAVPTYESRIFKTHKFPFRLIGITEAHINLCDSGEVKIDSIVQFAVIVFCTEMLVILGM